MEEKLNRPAGIWRCDMRFIDYRTKQSSTLPLRELPLDAVAVLDHLGEIYLVRQPGTDIIVGVWHHHCGAGLSPLAFLPGTYQFPEEGNPTDWHCDQQLNHATETFRDISEREDLAQSIVADMERQMELNHLRLPEGYFCHSEEAWWAEGAPYTRSTEEALQKGMELTRLQAGYFRALQHLEVPEFGLARRSRDLERQWLDLKIRSLLGDGHGCNVFGYCLWGYTYAMAEGYCVQLPERMRSTDISAAVAALCHLGCVPEFELDGRWLHAEIDILPLRTCEEVSHA